MRPASIALQFQVYHWLYGQSTQSDSFKFSRDQNMIDSLSDAGTLSLSENLASAGVEMHAMGHADAIDENYGR